MSRILVGFLITLTALSGCTRTEPQRPTVVQPEIDTWVVAATDPVSTIGHGAILSSDGKEIEAAPTFVIGAQRYYLKNLYLRADEKQRADIKGKLQRLQAGKPLAENDEILVNAALISWLIETLKPDNAAQLVMRNAVLRSESARISKAQSTPSPDVLQRLKNEGLAIPNIP